MRRISEYLLSKKEFQNKRSNEGRSRVNQFGRRELLEDGRNRYFKKYGQIVDRLSLS